MKNWWHILTSIGIAALGVVLPPLQHLVLGHPVITTVLGTVWAILGNLVQSPVKS